MARRMPIEEIVADKWQWTAAGFDSQSNLGESNVHKIVWTLGVLGMLAGLNGSVQAQQPYFAQGYGMQGYGSPAYGGGHSSHHHHHQPTNQYGANFGGWGSGSPAFVQPTPNFGGYGMGYPQPVYNQPSHHHHHHTPYPPAYPQPVYQQPNYQSHPWHPGHYLLGI